MRAPVGIDLVIGATEIAGDQVTVPSVLPETPFTSAPTAVSPALDRNALDLKRA